MELIYDLRGHMEQLYQEMSELRTSIKSCLDMQMLIQLQQSMNQEAQKGLYSFLYIFNYVGESFLLQKFVNASLGISYSSISL